MQWSPLSPVSVTSHIGRKQAPKVRQIRERLLAASAHRHCNRLSLCSTPVAVTSKGAATENPADSAALNICTNEDHPRARASFRQGSNERSSSTSTPSSFLEETTSQAHSPGDGLRGPAGGRLKAKDSALTLPVVKGCFCFVCIRGTCRGFVCCHEGASTPNR